MKNISHLFWPPDSSVPIGFRMFCLIMSVFLTGFFATADISGAASLKTARVRTAGSLYERPATASPVIAELPEGAELPLIHRQGEWFVTKLPDHRLGWVPERLFSPPRPPARVKDSGSDSRLIRDIRPEIAADGSERILFALNVPSSVAIEKVVDTFVITNDPVPKVVCDFFGTRLGEGIAKSVEVNGNLVRQIRIGVHGQPDPKLRVVADLFPGRNYEVARDFFVKERLYVLTVRPMGL